MIKKKYKLPINLYLKNKSNKMKFYTSFFSCLKSKNNLGYSLFGLVIPKSLIKRSVERNKLKRVFFNFINKNDFLLKNGWNYCFFMKNKPESVLLLKKDLENLK